MAEKNSKDPEKSPFEQPEDIKNQPFRCQSRNDKERNGSR